MQHLRDFLPGADRASVGKIRIGGDGAKPDFSVMSWFALIFVTRGLDGGVKVLSNINMGLAALLLLFVLLVGPTLTILSTVGVTFTNYVTDIVPLSNWIGREDEKFYHGWTIFY